MSGSSHKVPEVVSIAAASTATAIAFRAMQDAAEEISTATLFGREHLVVPVVALVEGVLWGENSDDPELALASEFGRFASGWNGRPVVMNHPKIDGVPVSAGIPEIMEEYSFGTIYNARIQDAKLIVDAWIDLERVEALGGEVSEIVSAIQEGTVIEVSTGLFTMVENRSGKFNGKKYNAIWRNIVPDHLAFLSIGVKGACSVEDGCGTPRNNSQAQNTEQVWQEFTMATTSTTQKTNCSCGGKTNAEAGPETEVLEDETGSTTTIEAEDDGNITGLEVKTQSGERVAFSMSRFLTNAAPAMMMDSDVRKLLQSALRKLGPNSYAYIYGFTADMVVYEAYDNASGTYSNFQRSYSIADDGAVTLGSAVEEVNILLNIIPAKAPTTAAISTNQENSNMNDSVNKPKIAGAGMGAPELPTPPVVSSAAQLSTVTNPAPAAPAAPAAPKTMSDYLSDMPTEMREMFESGIKLHSSKKEALIKTLKDCGRCKFSDDALKTMSLEHLEALAELANVPSYEGIATPRTQAAQTDDNVIPMPPPLFPAA